MSYASKSVASGETWEIVGAGMFARLLSTTGAVQVEFYESGSLKSVVDNVQGGFWRSGRFDRLRITDKSGGANVVEVVTDDEHVGYDRMSISGAIVAQAKSGTPTQAAATVTNASAVLLAANANRRHVIIQNNDLAGDIYINLAGAAAALASGLKIVAGGSYESSGWVSVAAIYAIGSIASNPNIVVIEGA